MRRTVTALAATAALATGGALLLAPHPADADTAAVSAASKLTDAQKQQLKESGHLTLSRKGKTVLVQRGAITALTATSVTLKSPDGYTHAYVVSGKTKVRGKGFPAVGERALVVAVHTDAGDSARRLRHGARQAS